MIFKSHNGIGHTELNCILDEDELNLSNGDADEQVTPAVTNAEYTFHPFSKIFNGKKITSYFWLAVSIIGIFVTAYMVGRLVAKYYRYEIAVGVTWNVTNKNPFPSITFCDMHMMVGQYLAYCGVPYFGGRHENESISCPRDKLKTTTAEKRDSNGTDDKWGNGIFQVLGCWLSDGSCSDGRYFKSDESLNHTCFTWNYDGNLHDKFGRVYLKFMVNKTYQNKISYVFGEIHDPAATELGRIKNRIKFESSKLYNIRVGKTVIKRLPAPYPSKCVTTVPYYIFPGVYTRKSCISSVMYLKLIEHCGDIHDYHRLNIPEAILAKHKRNSTIAETLKCMREFDHNGIYSSVDVTTCPIACEEMDLHVSVTSTNRTSNPMYSDNRTVYFIHIQYRDADYYKVMEEKAKYSFDELLAEICGVMCFIVGTSLITIIELLTYTFRKGLGVFSR